MILISLAVIWFCCVTRTLGTLPQTHISTRYWILNNKLVKNRENTLFNNRKSLPHRGLSPTCNPFLSMRKVLVNVFFLKSWSLQGESLWSSHVLPDTSSALSSKPTQGSKCYLEMDVLTSRAPRNLLLHFFQFRESVFSSSHSSVSLL